MIGCVTNVSPLPQHGHGRPGRFARPKRPSSRLNTFLRQRPGRHQPRRPSTMNVAVLRFYGDFTVNTEPIRAAVESHHRIVFTDVGLKPRNLVCCNVRWVRDNQIQGPRASVETMCRDESDSLRNPQPFGVLTRNGERRRTDVGRDPSRVRHSASNVEIKIPEPVPMSAIDSALLPSPYDPTMSSARSMTVSVSGRGSRTSGVMTNLRP